jgi:fibronectin-binding autotransporter adhesin
MLTSPTGPPLTRGTAALPLGATPLRDSALFGDITADRTATLSANTTAGNITLSNNANRWSVAGAFTLTLDGTLAKSGAGNATIGSTTLLAGAGNVTLSGGELQLLNNSNTFSGGITLNGGTLRVGNNNGTGAPQTSGSLGTGTFTINGGTIFQNQGNARIQAVAAVIGGNFTFNSVAGGGLILGTDGLGTRTVSLGSPSRTITVSENANGTGANSVLGLAQNDDSHAHVWKHDGSEWCLLGECRYAQ